MARATAAAGFAVKIFVEKHQITPVRVVRVFPNVPMTRADAILVRQKDASQSKRQLTRDFLERHHVSGAGRTLNFERFTIKQVVTFERLDDQEISREPNWTAPVRVTAKEIAIPFARNVIDPEFFVTRAEDIRLLAMDTRDRPNSVRGQEFVFIQHVSKRATQSIASWDRQHPVSGEGANLAICDERRQVLAVVEEPFHALLEARELADLRGLEVLDRDKRQQPYARPCP